MVQIMSDCEQGSRNRAERASLEGKPDFPGAPAKSQTTSSTNLVGEFVETVDSKFTDEEEEYEHYSVVRPLPTDEPNNNLSDSDKEWGIADPLAATASFVFPHFDEDVVDNATTQHILPLNKASKAHLESWDGQTKKRRKRRGSRASTASSHSRTKRERRERRFSKSSNSSGSTVSRQSTRSLKHIRQFPVTKRRRSTQSVGGRMENSEQSETKSISTYDPLEPVPSTSYATDTFCYRCQTKFSTYMSWKRHAVFEHIFKKDPYPIVEMNYIDPSTLGIAVDDESDQGGDDGPPNLIQEAPEPEQPALKIRISREKGSFYVKHGDDTSPKCDEKSPSPPLEKEIISTGPEALGESSSDMPEASGFSQLVPLQRNNLEAQYRIAGTTMIEATEVIGDTQVTTEDFDEVETSMINMHSPAVDAALTINNASGSEMISEEIPIVQLGGIPQGRQEILRNDTDEVTERNDAAKEDFETRVGHSPSLVELEIDAKDNDLPGEGENSSPIGGVTVVENFGEDLAANAEIPTANETGEKNSDESKDKETAAVPATDKRPSQDKETSNSERCSEIEDDDGDDCRCQICHQVFQTEDELQQHFSSEHFRVSGGGILEPESPFPPTPQRPIAQEEEEEITPSNVQPVQNAPTQVAVTRPLINQGPRQPLYGPSTVIQPTIGSAQAQLQRILTRQQYPNQPVVSRSYAPAQPQPQTGQNTMTPNVPGQYQGRVNVQIQREIPVRVPERLGASLQQQRLPVFQIQRPQFISGHSPQTMRQPQAAQVQQRASSPSFPVSLHSALTGTARPPNYSQAPIPSPARAQGIPTRIRGPIPSQQQQQPVRQVIAPYNPRPMFRSQNANPLNSSAVLNQQIVNAQRELNAQFQQRNASVPSRPMMHAAQQPQRPPPQQVVIMNQRPGPLSAKRPGSVGSELELTEVRGPKEPRFEQRSIQRPGSGGQNTNISAAIGSVGNPGVNCVRLGNSITLSVCPSSPSPSNSPSSNDGNGNFRFSPTCSPLSNAGTPTATHSSGMTVTRASPPTTSNSSPSNPSHATVQNASVIQRGPRSSSPDRNFSPPVITSVRGSLPVVSSSGRNLQQQQQHIFAVPRPPPPPMQRLGSGVTVNTSVERPQRPPTVDLTDDEVQSHTNHVHQRIGGVAPSVNQPRVVAAGPPNNQIFPKCGICGVMFPSIMSVNRHMLTEHDAPQSTVTSPSNGNGVVPRSPGAPTAIRSSSPAASRPTVAGSMTSNGQPIVRAPPAPISILRHQQPSPPVRSQSPNQPSGSNNPGTNQGKFLYIPLLDLSRIDAGKMRKLEEIGVSCVVPLQGNNPFSQMGIPVMSLRTEGAMGQHVPFDVVLPIGPVQRPTMLEQSGNRGGNGNIGR